MQGENQMEIFIIEMPAIKQYQNMGKLTVQNPL